MALFLLADLAWRAIALARADHFFRVNTPASVEKAVELSHGNAFYHALLAEHLESLVRDPDIELAEASQLSPYESRYWIRRAFRAEVEHKYTDSERYLHSAVQVDRGFDPQWALMNYYFRRGNMPAFWAATTAAARMSYGSLDPLFRLCLAASDDPAVIEHALPEERPIRLRFLSYLASKRIDLASRTAEELAENAEPGETKVFLDYCRKQTGHNDHSALLVWNALCRRGLLQMNQLSPDGGNIVTNGELRAASLHEGFDWVPETSASADTTPLGAGKGVSIKLAGQQQDGIELLGQALPLSPGRSYEIRFDYRLVADSTQSGLTWAVRVPDTGETLARSSVLTSLDWSSGRFTFAAGSHAGARLVLEHTRMPTTARWSGTVQIRNVESRLAGSGTAIK